MEIILVYVWKSELYFIFYGNAYFMDLYIFEDKNDRNNFVKDLNL